MDFTSPFSFGMPLILAQSVKTEQESEKFMDQTETVDESFERIKATLSLDCSPYLKCSKMAFSRKTTSLSSSHPFAEWTEKMQEEAINSLIQLEVPFRKVSLQQIYSLISQNQNSLCSNSSCSYPALFKGHAYYENVTPSFNPTEKVSFELEVHSDKKIYLIFRDHVKTNINQGNFKVILTAFSLSKPKKFSYSYSKPQANFSTNVTSNEEVYIKKCMLAYNKKNEFYIAKFHEIYYYQQQQVITMKWYPNDLLEVLNSKKRLSDQDKLQYSIQLIKAAIFLKEQKVLHRDLKTENILVNPQQISVTDFGFACDLEDKEEQKRLIGSLSYLAPEGLISLESKRNIDTWAIGCILWILWAEKGYPWYEETLKERPDHEKIKILINKYAEYHPEPRFKKSYLLSNILCLNPNDRWSPEQILSYLEEMQKELSSEPTYTFRNECVKEFEPYFNE